MPGATTLTRRRRAEEEFLTLASSEFQSLKRLTSDSTQLIVSRDDATWLVFSPPLASEFKGSVSYIAHHSENKSTAWNSILPKITTNFDHAIHNIRARENALRSIGIRHVVVAFISSNEDDGLGHFLVACQIRNLRNLDITRCQEMIIDDMPELSKRHLHAKLVQGHLEEFLQGSKPIGAFNLLHLGTASAIRPLTYFITCNKNDCFTLWPLPSSANNV